MRPVAFAVLFVLSASAFAQGEPPTGVNAGNAPAKPAAQPSAAAGGSSPMVAYDEAEARRLFGELDRNGDGYLSPAELGGERAGEGNWIAVDRDGDGRIGAAEFTAIKRR